MAAPQSKPKQAERAKNAESPSERQKLPLKKSMWPDLIHGVIKELRIAKDGTALEIPLDDVGGIGITNLRSAVHRGATAAGLEIETLADKKNFYVWKTRQIKAALGR